MDRIDSSSALPSLRKLKGDDLRGIDDAKIFDDARRTFFPGAEIPDEQLAFLLEGSAQRKLKEILAETAVPRAEVPGADPAMTAAQVPTPDQGVGADLVGSLKRGFYNTSASLAETWAAFGLFPGYYRKQADLSRAEAQAIPESKDVANYELSFRNVIEQPAVTARWLGNRVAETLVGTTPSILMGLATGGASLPVQAGAQLAVNAPLNVGAQLGDAAHDPQTGARRHLSPGAWSAAVSSGLISSGFESFADLMLVGRLTDLVKRSGLPAELQAKASQDLANGLLHVMRQARDQGVTEGVTEGVQSVIEDVGARYGWDPDRQIGEDLTESIVVGLASGKVLTGGPGLIAEGIGQARKAHERRLTAREEALAGDVLGYIAQNEAAERAFMRDPDAFMDEWLQGERPYDFQEESAAELEQVDPSDPRIKRAPERDPLDTPLRESQDPAGHAEELTQFEVDDEDPSIVRPTGGQEAPARPSDERTDNSDLLYHLERYDRQGNRVAPSEHDQDLQGLLDEAVRRETGGDGQALPTPYMPAHERMERVDPDDPAIVRPEKRKADLPQDGAPESSPEDLDNLLQHVNVIERVDPDDPSIVRPGLRRPAPAATGERTDNSELLHHLERFDRDGNRIEQSAADQAFQEELDDAVKAPGTKAWYQQEFSKIKQYGDALKELLRMGHIDQKQFEAGFADIRRQNQEINDVYRRRHQKPTPAEAPAREDVQRPVDEQRAGADPEPGAVSSDDRRAASDGPEESIDFDTVYPKPTQEALRDLSPDHYPDPDDPETVRAFHEQVEGELRGMLASRTALREQARTTTSEQKRKKLLSAAADLERRMNGYLSSYADIYGQEAAEQFSRKVFPLQAAGAGSVVDVLQRYHDEAKPSERAISGVRPELIEQVRQIEDVAGRQAVDVLGYGRDFVAIELSDGNVLKVAKGQNVNKSNPQSELGFTGGYLPEGAGSRPFDFPMLEQGEGWHIQPKAEGQGTAEQRKALQQQIEAAGYYISDPAKNQFGLLGGELKVLDYGAVEKQKGRQPAGDQLRTPEQIRSELARVSRLLQDAERVAGERYPAARNVTEEQREQALSMIEPLKREVETLRGMLRVVEAGATSPENGQNLQPDDPKPGDELPNGWRVEQAWRNEHGTLHVKGTRPSGGGFGSKGEEKPGGRATFAFRGKKAEHFKRTMHAFRQDENRRKTAPPQQKQELDAAAVDARRKEFEALAERFRAIGLDDHARLVMSGFEADVEAGRLRETAFTREQIEKYERRHAARQGTAEPYEPDVADAAYVRQYIQESFRSGEDRSQHVPPEAIEAALAAVNALRRRMAEMGVRPGDVRGAQGPGADEKTAQTRVLASLARYAGDLHNRAKGIHGGSDEKVARGLKQFQEALREAAALTGDEPAGARALDELAAQAKNVEREAPNPRVAELEQRYPLAGETVDGREVRGRPSNQASIEASLEDYTILPGIRQVPLSEFEADPKNLFASASDRRRVRELAPQILENGWIEPLIVVVDAEGPYVLEGVHRLGALHELGATSLPAMVVIDETDTETDDDEAPAPKRAKDLSQIELLRLRPGDEVLQGKYSTPGYKYLPWSDLDDWMAIFRVIGHRARGTRKNALDKHVNAITRGKRLEELSVDDLKRLYDFLQKNEYQGTAAFLHNKIQKLDGHWRQKPRAADKVKPQHKELSDQARQVLLERADLSEQLDVGLIDVRDRNETQNRIQALEQQFNELLERYTETWGKEGAGRWAAHMQRLVDAEHRQLRDALEGKVHRTARATDPTPGTRFDNGDLLVRLWRTSDGKDPFDLTSNLHGKLHMVLLSREGRRRALVGREARQYLHQHKPVKAKATDLVKTGARVFEPKERPQGANLVIREVRDFNVQVLGYVTAPHDGSQQSMREAARQASDRMFEVFPEASNVQSRIGITGDDGQPAFVISPNFRNIYAVGSAEARALMGDEQAIAEVFGRKQLQAPTPTPTPTPAPTEAAAAVDVQYLPLDQILVDEQRFQPRAARFSEQTAENVNHQFDERLFKPLDVWRDPADGKVYVLGGHSRREGLRRRQARGVTVGSVPVRFFEGTEQEAIEFAHTDNDRGARMANHERAAFLRQMRQDGATKADVQEKARELYGKDAATVIALSYLTPDGKAMQMLQAFSSSSDRDASASETMAKWIGQLRSVRPQLTDSHEREILDFLLKAYNSKFTSFPAFQQYVDARIQQRTVFGELDPALNFENFVPKSQQQTENEKRIRAAERELSQARDELEAERAKRIKQGVSGEDLDRVLKPFNDAVTHHQRKLLELKKELQAAEGQVKAQISIFDQLEEAGATHEEIAGAINAPDDTAAEVEAALQAKEASGEEPTPEEVDGWIEQLTGVDQSEESLEDGPAQDPSKPSTYGTKNKLFTKDAADDALEILRKKLGGELRVGIDPELMQAGITLAGYHIEAGARAFYDYYEAMRKALVRAGGFELFQRAAPYFRTWYEGVRHFPGIDNQGMTPAHILDEVDSSGYRDVIEREMARQEALGRLGKPIPAQITRRQDLNALLASQFKDLAVGADLLRHFPEEDLQAGLAALNAIERHLAANGLRVSDPLRGRLSEQLQGKKADPFGEVITMHRRLLGSMALIGRHSRFLARGQQRDHSYSELPKYQQKLRDDIARTFELTGEPLVVPTSPIPTMQENLQALRAAELERKKAEAEKKRGRVSDEEFDALYREWKALESKLHPRHGEAKRQARNSPEQQAAADRRAQIERKVGVYNLEQRQAQEDAKGPQHLSDLLKKPARPAPAARVPQEGEIWIDTGKGIYAGDTLPLVRIKKVGKTTAQVRLLYDPAMKGPIKRMTSLLENLVPYAPRFKAGDRVEWIDQKGKQKKGLVRIDEQPGDETVTVIQDKYADRASENGEPLENPYLSTVRHLDPEKRALHDASADAHLERNRPPRPDGVGQDDSGTSGGGDQRGPRATELLNAGARIQQQGDPGLSAGLTAAPRTQSDQPVPGPGEGPASTPGAAGRADGGRGGSPGQSGVPAEDGPGGAADLFTPAIGGERESLQDLEAGRRGNDADLAERAARQKAAEQIDVKLGDPENVRETLPVLYPEQQEDVIKAEARFYGPKETAGKGVLFTNGTGTGKTFTGLGVIKRFARRGLTNVLIVVPTDHKAKDWIEEAENLQLHITQLADTRDKGEGIVVTTYANFTANEALLERDFDLVVYDESHKLLSNQDGTDTGAVDKHRLITNHTRHALRRQQAIDKQYRHLEKRWKDTEAGPVKQMFHEKLQARKKELEPIAAELAERTKVVFLSATPFAYHKTLRYAEGYLFDFEDVGHASYNEGDGEDRFFMRHFGYRMRTNKLTQPESGVDVDLMERQFHERLKATGVVSGRRLEIDQDYSREFVQLDSDLGEAIDAGMSYLWENRDQYRELLEVAQKRWTWLYQNQLLEAIKARQSIERIRQHLELGRKVIVFHNYNNAQPPHPFRFGRGAGDLGQQIEAFEAARPDLVELNLSGLINPVATLTSAFGERAAVFNGTVPKQIRRQAVHDFNTDGSGVDVLVVQIDAGKEGISAHDVTGQHPRVIINLGLPHKPTDAIQSEGRAYRYGNKSNAVFEYIVVGTSFEARMFGEKIAQRSRTAENLALGEGARNLESAFREGYQIADHQAPSSEQGIGGKQADRAVETASAFDRAKTFYFAQAKKTQRTKSREGNDYFATPEPLGLKMIEWLHIRENERFLEPSAGHGAIARWAPGHAINVFVEPSYHLSSVLAVNASQTGQEIQRIRFEDLHLVNKYDAIAMNPPFGTAGKTAMDHIEKAAKHLKNGGRLIAIVPDGTSMQKRLDKFYESDQSNNLYVVADMRLPAVTFERAATAVRTRLIVLEKQTNEADGDKVERYFRSEISAETIGEFFDKIEHLELPDRVVPSEPEKSPAEQIVREAGLMVTRTLTVNGNRVFEVSGNTREHKDLLSDLGARWYGKKKVWSFYGEVDPTEKIAEALERQREDRQKAANLINGGRGATLPKTSRARAIDLLGAGTGGGTTPRKSVAFKAAPAEPPEEGRRLHAKQMLQAPPPAPAQARVTWPFEPPETKAGSQLVVAIRKDSEGARIGMRSIVELINAAVFAELRVGREQTSRRHPAQYEYDPHLIRSRSGTTIFNFHEAGHALHAWLQDEDPHVLAPWSTYLTQLTTRKGSLASAETVEEGFAEWVRLYVMDLASVAGDKETKQIEKLLGDRRPDVLAALRDAHRAYLAHRQRSPQARFRSLSTDAPARPSWWRQVGETIDEVIFYGVARRHAIERLKRGIYRTAKVFSDTKRQGIEDIRKFFESTAGTKADITAAYQTVLKVPMEVARAVDGARGKGGVRVLMTGDMDRLSEEERNALEGAGFNLAPLDAATHGNYVQLYEKSMSDVVKQVGVKKWPAFENYVHMKVSLERYQKKQLDFTGIFSGETPADLERAVKAYEAENPGFVEALRDVNDYMDALLLASFVGGTVSAKSAAQMKEAYEWYAPLLRKRERGPTGRGSSGTTISAKFHRARGSDLPITSLLSAVERRTEEVLRAYYQNRMAISLIELTRQIDKDKRLDFRVRKMARRAAVRLKLDWTKVATLKEDEARRVIADFVNQERARERIMELQSPAKIKQWLDALKKDPKKVLDQVLQEWEKIGPGDVDLVWSGMPIWRRKRPGAVRVLAPMVNGERQFYQVEDRLLFDLFAKADDPGKFLQFLIDLGMGMTRPWKRILTRNFVFALRNVPRDAAYAIFSGVPAEYKGHVTKASAVKNLVPGIYATTGLLAKLTGKRPAAAPTGELLARTFQSTTSAAHKARVGKFRSMLEEGIIVTGWRDLPIHRKAAHVPGIVFSTMLKPIELLAYAGGGFLSETMEEASRLGAFHQLKAAGLTDEVAQVGFDTITGNFGDAPASTTISALYRTAGFLNPAFQITYDIYRRLAHHDPAERARAWLTLAYVAVPTAIAWAINYLLTPEDELEKDEERPDDERLNTMAFYLPGVGRTRIPFDYGIIGGVQSFTWNMLDHLAGQGLPAKKKMARNLLARLGDVPGEPSAFIQPQIKALLEAQLNYQFYFDERILPTWMEDLPAEDQVFFNTPDFYRSVGAALGVSPVKVQHFVKSGMARQMDEMIRLLEDLGDDKKVLTREFPFTRRLLHQNPKGWGSKSVQDLDEITREYYALRRRLTKQLEQGITTEHTEEQLIRIDELELYHMGLLEVSRLWKLSTEARQVGEDGLQEELEHEMTRTARIILERD